jgi:predicted O-methyltransferase YrrM
VRRIVNARTGLFAVLGTAAAALAWLLGPRLAIAAAVGAGVGGGLFALDWLRSRHRQLTASLAKVDAAMARRDHLVAWEKRADEARVKERNSLSERMSAARRHDFAQLQALMNLYAMVPVRDRMPATRVSWTASPDVLLLLVSLIRANRPHTIVELGSGVSTVWMALALREFGIDGRVVSLDHELSWAETTRVALHALDLAKLAEVRHAPLADLELDGEIYPWYDRSALADVDSCDLAFVDGPPGVLRPASRYPALPVLGSRMAIGGQVVVDDYGREDEHTMVDRWIAKTPGWTLRDHGLEKGAAVLTRTA